MTRVHSVAEGCLVEQATGIDRPAVGSSEGSARFSSVVTTIAAPRAGGREEGVGQDWGWRVVVPDTATRTISSSSMPTSSSNFQSPGVVAWLGYRARSQKRPFQWGNSSIHR